MSWPPKDNGGGNGGSGNGGKMMSLRLESDVGVNVGEFSKIPFDQIPENDGFTYNADLEIEVQEGGTVLIAATAGAVIPVGTTEEVRVACLIHKNGIPIRQNSMEKLLPPYCTAAASVIDKCVPGDKYIIYVLAEGGDNTSITIAAGDGVTGAEIAYL